MTVPVTVVIVDDHPGFRSFARALLEAEGFEVVGEAEVWGAKITSEGHSPWLSA